MIVLNWILLSALTLAVKAGTEVWSGNFDYYATAADFDLWSWSDEVGEYQWYIHGNESTSDYLALDTSYNNPADTSETQGLKLTIDPTSTWNSAYLRSELIPQTSANIGTGVLYYHFSLSFTETNAPNADAEHQICFFESHFTELKLGVGAVPTNLVWMVTEVEYWNTTFEPGVWYNFAYDIDFTGGTVGLWTSTGGEDLVQVAQGISAAASSNSEDWHLGLLRLAGGVTEDWYFSGVYVESGPITTAIGAGGAILGGSGSSTTITTTGTTSSGSTTTTPTTTPTTTTTTSTATQTEYGQCGGTGYSGPTVCASGCTCTAVSPPYYYQCLVS